MGRALMGYHENFVIDLRSRGGALGRRIADHDWSSTAIGAIPGWPRSLMHTVGFILRSPVPLVLLWGEQGVMIYNEAYSVLAGARDSGLLGANVRPGDALRAAIARGERDPELASNERSWRERWHREGSRRPMGLWRTISPRWKRCHSGCRRRCR